MVINDKKEIEAVLRHRFNKEDRPLKKLVTGAIVVLVMAWIAGVIQENASLGVFIIAYIYLTYWLWKREKRVKEFITSNSKEF